MSDEERHRSASQGEARKRFHPRRFLVPDVLLPLPVLRDPMFPTLTDRLIYWTHRYVPGASGFVEDKGARAHLREDEPEPLAAEGRILGASSASDRNLPVVISVLETTEAHPESDARPRVSTESGISAQVVPATPQTPVVPSVVSNPVDMSSPPADRETSIIVSVTMDGEAITSSPNNRTPSLPKIKRSSAVVVSPDQEGDSPAAEAVQGGGGDVESNPRGRKASSSASRVSFLMDRSANKDEVSSPNSPAAQASPSNNELSPMIRVRSGGRLSLGASAVAETGGGGGGRDHRPIRPLRRWGSSSSTSSSNESKRSLLNTSELASKFIQLGIMLGFSLALFYALLINGYIPRTENGRPSTYRPSTTFWPGRALDMSSAVTCGPDAHYCRPLSTINTWIGVHCLPLTGMSPEFSMYVRGGADGFYTADSQVCSSAVHAGVITAQEGGCFEVRLAGPRNFYKGEPKNGVFSRPFGWFPRSMEFRRVNQAMHCTDARWASDLVASIGLTTLALVWRIEPMWMNHLAAQWGFYYAGLIHNRWSGDFWMVINDLSAKQFTLIPMCCLLFYLFGRPGFCPDPRKFPIEATLFFCAFFWTFVHIEDFDSLFDANFTLSASGLSNPSVGTMIILGGIALLVPPLGFLQARTIYRAGLFPLYVVAFFLLAVYLTIVALASERGTLQFHFHHYFFGLMLCVVGRGQRKYSIVLQAVGLALFVEGLALWDTDPLFSERRGPNVGYQVDSSGIGYEELSQNPILSRAEFNRTDPLNPVLTLEWILPSQIVTNYTCDDNTTDLIPGIARVTSAPTLAPSPSGRRLQYSSPSYDDAGETTSSNGDDSLEERVFLITEESVAIPQDLGPFENRTQLFPFTVYRNGIMFPSLYFNARLKETIALDPGSTVGTPENPLIVSVALIRGGSSFRIPFPFPYDNDPVYHAPDDVLCDRIMGIYSRLRALDANATRKAEAWWL